VSGEGRPVVFTPMRAAIGRRMTRSKQSIPHFYVSMEMEMDSLLTALAGRNAGRAKEARVSVTACLVRVVALALGKHPAFNAVWKGDVLEEKSQANIGVAIALDDGLIAPALLDCGARDIDDIAGGLADLVVRARADKLRSSEVSDATFTLSNLGMFAVSRFTAIITPPQVAILATGRVIARPVVRDGQMVVRQVLEATLSADHRAVDGAGAACLLETCKELIEAPGPIFAPAG